MTVSRIFLYSCVAFILGVTFNSFFNSLVVFWLICLILGTFLIFVFLGHKESIFFGLCIVFLLFGILRHQLAESILERPELENLKEREVVLMGYIVEEPEIRTSKIKLRVKVPKLKTQVLVTTGLFPQLRYGDRLKLKGTIKEPPQFEGFNYKEHLKKEGIYFLMNYPEVEVLEKNRGNPIKTTLFSFKGELKNSLRRITPFPQSGFFEALLFGEEENISQEWKEKLNITGTRHIAAVSGANITIISNLILYFLLALGFWRKQALFLSFFLISLYVLMIGAPACGVRAAIMASLLLASQYFGRLVDPSRLIIFALTTMLLQNPVLLRYDIGFQLSFLAVAGLVYLQSHFLKIMTRIPKNLELRNSLSSTLSAQIFVLPILLYNFGQISLVSPLTNILILPAIPFLTIIGFLFSFLGVFSQTLGQIISWPAYFLLTLIMEIINFFSKIPFASKNFEIGWAFLLVSYLFLAVLILWLKKREKLEFLKY